MTNKIDQVVSTLFKILNSKSTDETKSICILHVNAINRSEHSTKIKKYQIIKLIQILQRLN